MIPVFKKSVEIFHKIPFGYSTKNHNDRNCKILIQDLTHQDLYMQRFY